jgi:hypothetical protein
MKCFICGKEVSKDDLRAHLAEHLGIELHDGKVEGKPQETLPARRIEGVPSKLPAVTPTPKLPLEAEPTSIAKKRYLTGQEIINLIHNTNKQFPPKEVGECPLTKTGEEP